MMDICNFFGGSATFFSLFLVSMLLSVVVSEISLGSKLTVTENKLWVSSNGVFALGFFNHSDHPDEYSLGIRFHSDSIPVDKQTLVWVAGAELTVSNHSYFQLSPEGGLVLFDSANGGVVWMSNSSGESVSSASLQDDGNLVVLDVNNGLVWQSFDTPSDTLLPGQNLSVHRTLRAQSRNSVSSYYSLYMSDSGHLQLRWESSKVYWESESPSNRSIRAYLSSTGSFQLLDEGSEVLWSVFAEDHNDSVKFRFLRLDVDGNLRVYSWDKDLVSWRSVWQAVENQCNVFATCGDHGVCSFSDSGNPICKCLFRSPSVESNSDCLTPYAQSCDSRVSMVGYKHTSLYGIYPPNDTVNVTSLGFCQSLCKKDPLCTAVTYVNDGTAQCLVKRTRYITGYSDPSLSAISFVKTCMDPMAVLPDKSPAAASPSSPSLPFSESIQSNRFPVRSLVDAALASFCMFCILQVVVGFWVCKRRVKTVRKKANSPHGFISAGLVRWSYAEIKELTGNFKDQLGPHSYKAVLQNNQPALVRRLESQIEERRFKAMVSIIGSIYHKNLVKVEGFCCESGHRFLVYEFLHNGSLEDFMHDLASCKRLTWKNRMLICLGVAKAISYLHTECRDFVSHGNLTCGNVILDENLEVKVTEFGLQRLDGFETSAEKDVEDFGKLVLYLVSGRQEVHEDVREWSYNKWVSGYGWRVVDKRIEGEVDFEELERALRIAFWCLQVDERMRPSMGEVVNVLEGTLTVDPPPPPFTNSGTSQEDK